jgi:soluble lytic murein transglycosylase
MNRRFRALRCLFAFAVFAALSNGAAANSPPKKIQKRAETKSTTRSATKSAPDAGASHRPQAAEAKPEKPRTVKSKVARAKASSKARIAARHKSKPSTEEPQAPLPLEAPALSPDLAALKQSFALISQGKTTEATALKQSISDPVAQKLVEWQILHHPDGQAGFSRYAAFMAENPGWPGIRLFRRRAEARLWQEKSGASTVAPFVGTEPVSGRGLFALARVRLVQGDRAGAERLAREAWRSQDLSERVESEAYDSFHDLLTADDHRARMDRRIGAKDFAAAMRAARHLGDDDVAIVKACAAVYGGASKAPDLLEAVSAEARTDLGYTLCRAHWLMRKERYAEAAQVMLGAAPATMASQDTDEWWRERRVAARKLLDAGDFRTAYEVVREAAAPANENYRAEAHFLPGWIALRYLDEPATAREQFAHIDDGASNPIVLARANYWRGRAAEAIGDSAATRTFFEAAASHPTAYYGQLARAKLGLQNFALRLPPQPDLCRGAAFMDERVHAADMLYAIGERDLVVSFVTDLAEESSDTAVLAALGELAGLRNDARAMLGIGKAALARGLALDFYAFPDIGIPQYAAAGPAVDSSVIYSVARTESAFDQRDRSPAMAVGLMQVTPEAGRDTAKRIGLSYSWDRLVSDPVYNTQMGAGELAALLREYRGSHIMTFAGYNAGRGRVQQWIKQYGDPRDPKVDPVDWVERIPFSETRNYVQRVMENLMVYRVRFADTPALPPKQDAAPGPRYEADAAPH